MEEEIMASVENLNSWSNIPPNLASLILCHMPYKDRFNFRATCKSWSCRGGGGFHEQHRPPFMLELYKHKYHLFDPLTNAYQKPMSRQLPKAKILYSNFGWLLMGKVLGSSALSMFFFNPFTNARLDLPDFPLTEQAWSFSFSRSPASTRRCFVLGIAVKENKWVHINLWKTGEESWAIFHLNFLRSPKSFYGDCCPVFHKGEFYCLDENGWVAVFDPRDPEPSLRICGKPFSPKRKLPPKAGQKDYYLVGSGDDGELFCVRRCQALRQLCIYKLHDSTKEWIKVNYLDDKIVYVSCTGSLMETTKFKGLGNKIYFPRFHGRLMMFYSLDTKKYHSYGDEFWSHDTLFGFSESIYSAWVKPMV